MKDTVSGNFKVILHSQTHKEDIKKFHILTEADSKAEAGEEC